MTINDLLDADILIWGDVYIESTDFDGNTVAKVFVMDTDCLSEEDLDLFMKHSDPKLLDLEISSIYADRMPGERPFLVIHVDTDEE